MLQVHSTSEKLDTDIQFSTFYVNNQLYGVNVSLVQEVTKSMVITKVPLAPNYVKGLLNLRGQIATAISIRQLFQVETENSNQQKECFNVFCHVDGILLSILVDQVSDVVELNKKDFEPTPDTVNSNVSNYLEGVYKTPKELLCIIDMKKISEILNN